MEKQNPKRNLWFTWQEWYVKVDVDAKTGKDKKVLKQKYDRFLPAGTSQRVGPNMTST